MDQKIVVTVDVVLLTLVGERLEVLLSRREREPFAEQWALPGGYVHAVEDADGLAAVVGLVVGQAGRDARQLPDAQGEGQQQNGGQRRAGAGGG